MSDNRSIKVIETIANHDKQLKRQLLFAFITQTKKNLSELQRHFKNQAWNDLKLTAHTMKGTFSSIKMDEAEELAALIEKMATNNSKFNETALHTLISIANQAIQEFEEELASV